VTYDAGNFADAFSVPSLKPLDNLTTRVEKPDASGLNLIARKIYNNGDFQFGYLDETRLEFKNSFQAVRVVKATAKEKNPTPTTRWDTVFAIDANSCKKLVSDSGNTGSSTGTGSIPDGIAPESAKYKCLTHESTRVYLSKEQCIQSGCASQYCIKVDAAL
jgi:hypothetical protein